MHEDVTLDVVWKAVDGWAAAAGPGHAALSKAALEQSCGQPASASMGLTSGVRGLDQHSFT